MSAHLHRPRPGPPLTVVLPPTKHEEVPTDYEPNQGNLSPDIQSPFLGGSLPPSPVGSPLPASPATCGVTSPLALAPPPPSSHPLFSDAEDSPPSTYRDTEPLPHAFTIAKYIIFPQNESQGDVEIYRAIHMHTQEEYVCKVVLRKKFHELFSVYLSVGHHEHINQISEVVHGSKHSYVMFPRHYGDLHSYVRAKRRLRETETGDLFKQVMSAVHHCHSNGLVIRDLKLRKFVFKDAQKTQLKLEAVEDVFVIGEDDRLSDKHGCPAYVAPEILRCEKYSGRAADMWSAGVMLFTMLAGRYPFHDVQPTALFQRIRRGEYRIPDCVSSRAKNLIRSLLRKNPSERLSAEHVLQHAWFHHGSKIAIGGGYRSCGNTSESYEQTVPCFTIEPPPQEPEATFFL